LLARLVVDHLRRRYRRALVDAFGALVADGLAAGDVSRAHSRETLADGGNRSSATVLFILEALLGSGEVEPGRWLVALAFGTGLTLEALLLRT